MKSAVVIGVLSVSMAVGFGQGIPESPVQYRLDRA